MQKHVKKNKTEIIPMRRKSGKAEESQTQKKSASGKTRKTGSGRPKNVDVLLPMARDRVKAWTRVLKKFVAPEMSQEKPEKDRFQKALAERYNVHISPTQWKKWWGGKEIPSKKSVDEIKRAEALRDICDWLKPDSKNCALRRYLCAIDAFCVPSNEVGKNRELAKVKVEAVIDAIHARWAPYTNIGFYSYPHNFDDDTTGVSEWDGDGNITTEQIRKGSKNGGALLRQQTSAYDPFSKNSILIFLLAIGVYELLPSEKLIRTWAVDLAATIWAIDAYGYLNGIDDVTRQQSAIGMIVDWKEKFLCGHFDETGIVHNLKRWPLPLKIEPTALVETLKKAAFILAQQCSFIGIEQESFLARINNITLPNMHGWYESHWRKEIHKIVDRFGE